jgi:hypothetical protein
MNAYCGRVPFILAISSNRQRDEMREYSFNHVSIFWFRFCWMAAYCDDSSRICCWLVIRKWSWSVLRRNRTSRSRSTIRCSFDRATVLMILRLTSPIALRVDLWAFVLISHLLYALSEAESDGLLSTVGGGLFVEGSQYSHTPLTVANCFFMEYQSFQSL